MKTVVMLVFDGVNALDVAGPLEVMAAACGTDDEALYEARIWSLDGARVRAESGLQLCGEPLPSAPQPQHTLLVPGGPGLREPDRLLRIAQWLRQHHAQFERVASICTGAYAMAASGLWDGRRVTTHWQHALDLASQYPHLKVEADALYLADGKFHSSGGVAAGIDLALSLVEHDAGPAVAAAVARMLVVHLRRSGSQSQYSEMLKFQSRSHERLADVCAWIAGNLGADLSAPVLAQRAGMSERHFSRRFAAAYGESPIRHVKRLRLTAAREALAAPQARVDQVARLVGFDSADGFRRAFQQQFGLTPQDCLSERSTPGGPS
jgi:transcriptional regulator GlxA family with amidase domain